MKHFLLLGLCVAAFSVISTTRADAANLAWYRMGEDDPSAVAGAAIPWSADGNAGIVNNLSGSGAWGNLRARPNTTDGVGVPTYSDVVPSQQIYDPITGLTHDNELSYKITTHNDSKATKTNYKWDSQFTLEMFLYFDVTSMSPVRGMEFLNHRTNAEGGWRFYVENASGAKQDTIRGEFFTFDNNLSTPALVQFTVNSTTKMQPNTWYHFGVIYKENEDTSHSAELYINHLLESTGAIPAGHAFHPTEDFQVIMGRVAGGLSSGRSITIDEFRYFDEALTSASFLQAVPPGVAGDFDGDGDVDGADFVVWQTNFPSTGAATAGDADGDADVDGADFEIWQNSFPAGSSPGTTPVPEPKFASLLGAAAILFLAARRQIGRSPARSQ